METTGAEKDGPECVSTSPKSSVLDLSNTVRSNDLGTGVFQTKLPRSHRGFLNVKMVKVHYDHFDVALPRDSW